MPLILESLGFLDLPLLVCHHQPPLLLLLPQLHEIIRLLALSLCPLLIHGLRSTSFPRLLLGMGLRGLRGELLLDCGLYLGDYTRSPLATTSRSLRIPLALAGIYDLQGDPCDAAVVCG